MIGKFMFGNFNVFRSGPLNRRAVCAMNRTATSCDRILHNLFFVFCFLLFVNLLQALTISEKLTLEDTWSKRLQEVISRVLRTDNVIVIVNIEPNTEKSEIEKEVWEPKKVSSVAEVDRRVRLPGVPPKKKLEEIENITFSRSYERIISLPESMIKSIRVTVMVSHKTPDDKIAQIEKICIETLGLDLSKDKVAILKKEFPSWLAENINDVVKRLNPVYLVLGIIVVLFLLSSVRLFMKRLIKAVESSAKKNTGIWEGQSAGSRIDNPLNRPMNWATTMRENNNLTSSGEGHPLTDRPFSGIMPESGSGLLQALSGFSLTETAIALMYLEKALSVYAVSRMDNTRRVEILKMWKTGFSPSSDEVLAVEKKLSEALKIICDPSGKGDEVVSLLDEQDQKDIMLEIKRTGGEMPAGRYLPDRVRKLGADSLKILLFRCGAGDFILFLSTIPEQAAGEILSLFDEKTKKMLEGFRSFPSKDALEVFRMRARLACIVDSLEEG